MFYKKLQLRVYKVRQFDLLLVLYNIWPKGKFMGVDYKPRLSLWREKYSSEKSNLWVSCALSSVFVQLHFGRNQLKKKKGWVLCFSVWCKHMQQLGMKKISILRPSVSVLLSKPDKRSWQMVRSQSLASQAWQNVFIKLEESQLFLLAEEHCGKGL